MVNPIVWAYVLGAVIVVGIVGFLFFMYARKKGSKKKFPFLLYSLDGMKAKEIDAIVRIDKTNASKKVFYFPEFDTELPIKEPTWYFMGTNYRQVVQDRNGELQYLSTPKINKDYYMEVSVDPEEKALALYRYKENMRRYENPMDKTSAMMFIGGLILVLLIMIGIIYSTISFASAASKNVEFVREQNKGIAQQKQISDTHILITEQLAVISAALLNDTSIIRQVG